MRRGTDQGAGACVKCNLWAVSSSLRVDYEAEGGTRSPRVRCANTTEFMFLHPEVYRVQGRPRLEVVVSTKSVSAFVLVREADKVQCRNVEQAPQGHAHKGGEVGLKCQGNNINKQRARDNYKQKAIDSND